MAHDPVLNQLRNRIRRNRKSSDERNSRKKASALKRRIAFLQHQITKVVHRRHGLDHEAVLDGTPMHLGHKLMLLDGRRNGWPGVATSVDRRDHPSFIVRLIHRLGKSTQAELYYGWAHHLPGFLPANPPDRGTHMQIGDGVVGNLFQKLAWWQMGIDATDSTTLRSALVRLGYAAYRPYSSASEEHHTNLRRDPKSVLIARGLV